jgi:hypothetical protein
VTDAADPGWLVGREGGQTVANPQIPDVEETGLTRDEMETAADDLGVDHEGLDDQQLLEQLGVALGELDEDEVDTPPASSEDADSGDADSEAASDEAEAASDEAEDEGDDADGNGDVQSAVGEPIDGPTRDELREELRERDLPVSGTKEELQERLAEATEDG